MNNKNIQSSITSKSTTPKAKKPVWSMQIPLEALNELRESFEARIKEAEEAKKLGGMRIINGDFELTVRAYARQLLEEACKRDSKLCTKIYIPYWISGSTQGTWAIEMKLEYFLDVEENEKGWIAMVKKYSDYK